MKRQTARAPVVLLTGCAWAVTWHKTLEMTEHYTGYTDQKREK